jgi:hypothetical protein
MRPSLVYQFDYSALTHGLQRQPAEIAAGILEHTPRGFTNRSDADAQEPMLLHADSQIELDTSVRFMGKTLRHESIDKTVENIAKKVSIGFCSTFLPTEYLAHCYLPFLAPCLFPWNGEAYQGVHIHRWHLQTSQDGFEGHFYNMIHDSPQVCAICR